MDITQESAIETSLHITLDAEQTELYNSTIASILESDTFSTDCIGFWACGVISSGDGGDRRWLLWEEASGFPEKEAEAIAAWKDGQPLPEGYYYFNRDQAERVIAIGILAHGIGFLDGTTDANDLDIAIQKAVLGEKRYC